jgi:hypothetical protein
VNISLSQGPRRVEVRSTQVGPLSVPYTWVQSSDTTLCIGIRSGNERLSESGLGMCRMGDRPLKTFTMARRMHVPLFWQVWRQMHIRASSRSVNREGGCVRRLRIKGRGTGLWRDGVSDFVVLIRSQLSCQTMLHVWMNQHQLRATSSAEPFAELM